jgi:hypothetical protein
VAELKSPLQNYPIRLNLKKMIMMNENKLSAKKPQEIMQSKDVISMHHKMPLKLEAISMEFFELSS